MQPMGEKWLCVTDCVDEEASKVKRTKEHQVNIFSSANNSHPKF